MDAMDAPLALLSVSDKTGLIPFAQGLVDLDISLISTGGTAKALRGAGLPLREVQTVTGFPEMMDGRVKTLHPKIHGGILCDRSIPGHVQSAEEHGIELISFVAVNLYPFKQTVARTGATASEIIENIDIGGPAMIRSAAKNHEHVTVIVDPADYDEVLTELRGSCDGHTTFLETRARLAAKVFALTSDYEESIRVWFQAYSALVARSS